DPDIKSVFSQFDRDGNGYLGASDLAAVYRSLGEHLDDDLIDELIREADKDGDGQIGTQPY
ncbi:magnesium-bound form of calmodulin C-domain E104dE140D mutant, partial [Baffinella frigidus]